MPDGLGIPEQQKGALAQLLRFSQKDRKQLLDVLKESKPSLFGRSFTSAWMKQTGASEGDARELFHLLAGLYASMDIARETSEAFAATVSETIKASKDPALQSKGIDWEEFKTTSHRASRSEAVCEGSVAFIARYLPLC